MKRTALAAVAATTIIAFTACSPSDEPPATTEAASAPVAATEEPESSPAEDEFLADNEQFHEVPEFGTRTEPLALGEVVTLGPWDLTVTDTELLSGQQPGDEYLLEEELPAADEDRIMATYEVTHNGGPDESEAPGEYLYFSYVDASGMSYESGGYMLPEGYNSYIDDMYGGSSASAETASVVPTSEINGGVWVVEYLDPETFEPVTAYFDGTPES